MSSKPKQVTNTSTHGGHLGQIVFGSFEGPDGSVTAHVWDYPGWSYRDYCIQIANMLRTFAQRDDVPIEVVWDCVIREGRILEDICPTGVASTKH